MATLDRKLILNTIKRTMDVLAQFLFTAGITTHP
jgi:hypothetical protein